MEVQLEGHMTQKWKKWSVSQTVSQSHSQLVSHSFTRSLNHSLTHSLDHSSFSHSSTHHSVTESLSQSVTNSLSHSVIRHTFALYSAPTAFSTFPRFDESPAKHISRQYIKSWLNHKIITSKNHPPTNQPSSLLSSSLSAPKGFRFFFLADALWWKNATSNEWSSNASQVSVPIAVHLVDNFVYSGHLFPWQRTFLENQCMTKTTQHPMEKRHRYHKATIPEKITLGTSAGACIPHFPSSILENVPFFST